MVAAIILGLHILGALYALLSRMRKGGWSEGILAFAFVGVIFSVGWTIMTMVTSLFLEPEGLAKWLNRDAVTLVLLTITEGAFYYFLLKERNIQTPARRDRTTKSDGTPNAQ